MQNIQQAIKQAQMLQQKISDLQHKLESEIVEGRAGGDMVRVKCTCKGEAKEIEIDESLLNPNEKEMLEDLIITAFNNAKKNSDLKNEEEMQKISSSSGISMDMLNSALK